jgi:hypothetical protein
VFTARSRLQPHQTASQRFTVVPVLGLQELVCYFNQPILYCHHLDAISHEPRIGDAVALSSRLHCSPTIWLSSCTACRSVLLLMAVVVFVLTHTCAAELAQCAGEQQQHSAVRAGGQDCRLGPEQGHQAAGDTQDNMHGEPGVCSTLGFGCVKLSNSSLELSQLQGCSCNIKIVARWP